MRRLVVLLAICAGATASAVFGAAAKVPAVYESCAHLWNRGLDRDRDGIACEA
jgi:hypothetical protein